MKLSILIVIFVSITLFVVASNEANAGLIIRPPAYLGLSTGLVGYWTFDGPDISGTRAKDRSGQNNHGTLTNGPVQAVGRIGQALNFDGVNDYVDIGDKSSMEGLSEISVSAWIKTNQITADGEIVTKGAAGQAVWLLFQNDIGSVSGRTNMFTFAVGNGSTLTRIEGATGIAKVEQWTHVVGVWKQSPETINLYVNGVQDSSTPTLSGVTMTTGADSVRIGDDGSLGGTNVFNGLIDEVRFYNRALSADEVRKLYNMGR